MPMGARVQATTVRVRDHFVNARYGRTARERYRAAASPDLRATFLSSGNTWVDFRQFIEATDLACTMFASGNPALAREIGAFGAETNMGTWRAIAHRLLSPRTILNIAAGLWGHHYDGGRLEVHATGDAGVHVILANFPEPHRVHCLAIEGWIEKTISLGRPRTVRVRHVKCRLDGAPACEFAADWE